MVRFIRIKRVQRNFSQRLPEFWITCDGLECTTWTTKAGTKLSEALRLEEATDKAQRHNGIKHGFRYMLKKEEA